MSRKHLMPIESCKICLVGTGGMAAEGMAAEGDMHIGALGNIVGSPEPVAKCILRLKRHKELCDMKERNELCR